MFLQNKGHVTMTIELLDTEEAQADDPLDVQVNTCLQTLVYKHLFSWLEMNNLTKVELNFPTWWNLLCSSSSSLSACRATWSSL